MAENNDLPMDENFPEDDSQGVDEGATENSDAEPSIAETADSMVDGGSGDNGDDKEFGEGEFDVGNVRIITIEDEMRASYLEYAMSVIVARALPDARDGLKPVHRRILYAMNDMGLTPGSSHKKSARVVGEVLGKYHPHGDSAVYDAMARMAQDFSLRYPLVDGQGNFGSVDGDSPAAMRYTEAKLSRVAMPILQDIDMDTVDWGLNFDDSLEEPLVLPGALPNLLINGTTGIAVGMATNIPPHNLTEISNAIVHMIDNWERREDVSLEELMTFVKGPDFPTGGLILGTDGIASAFATGRGRVLVRARTEIEETKNNRFRIIVTEIPYQVNKSSLIERMAELVREGKLDQISDLRDESDRKGMRIVIELKRGAAPKKVANRLFKYTQLQGSFGVNTLALVDGQPVTLSLRRALTVYVEHRQDVLTRRTQFELRKARERAHILEGLRIALENLDEVIRTIRASQSVDDARSQLMSKFGLSEVQAQAILDMQLRRLAALERQKIEDEYQAIMAKINYLEDLLAHPAKIRALVRDCILEIKEKFGDERRSQIIAGSGGEFNEEDLISQENVLISYSAGSYIKRVDASAFKAQGRGGRGVKGMTTKAEDEVIDLLFARTLDHILFFTDKGRVYSSRVYELPEGSRTARGSHIANLLSLMANENVLTMLVIENFDQANYITLATRKGRIKRMELSAFSNIRVSGLIAMNLDPDDSLDWARLTNGEEDFMIVTRGGKSLRFHEKAVRAMGRTAAGVMAIRLLGDDQIVSVDVVKPESDLFVLHELGYGKRVSLDEYSPNGRYTQGIWTTDHRRLKELGPIVSARVVEATDQVTVMTSNGIVLRTPVAGVSRMGRSTRGVRVVNLQKGDTVAAVAVLGEDDLERKVEGEEEGASPDGSTADGTALPVEASDSSAESDNSETDSLDTDTPETTEVAE